MAPESCRGLSVGAGNSKADVLSTSVNPRPKNRYFLAQENQIEFSGHHCAWGYFSPTVRSVKRRGL